MTAFRCSFGRIDSIRSQDKQCGADLPAHCLLNFNSDSVIIDFFNVDLWYLIPSWYLMVLIVLVNAM